MDSNVRLIRTSECGKGFTAASFYISKSIVYRVCISRTIDYKMATKRSLFFWPLPLLMHLLGLLGAGWRDTERYRFSHLTTSSNLKSKHRPEPDEDRRTESENGG